MKKLLTLLVWLALAGIAIGAEVLNPFNTNRASAYPGTGQVPVWAGTVWGFGVGGSATNLTPWPSDINAAYNSLTNVASVVTIPNGSVTASNFIGDNTIARTNQNHFALSLTNAAAFQPASVNLSNWSQLGTNVITGMGGTNFNPSQFNSSGGQTNIAAGLSVTNMIGVGTNTFDTVAAAFIAGTNGVQRYDPSLGSFYDPTGSIRMFGIPTNTPFANQHITLVGGDFAWVNQDTISITNGIGWSTTLHEASLIGQTFLSGTQNMSGLLYGPHLDIVASNITANSLTADLPWYALNGTNWLFGIDTNVLPPSKTNQVLAITSLGPMPQLQWVDQSGTGSSTNGLVATNNPQFYMALTNAAAFDAAGAAAAAIVPLALAFTNNTGHTLYVDPSGNDSTAIAGRTDLPWKTICDNIDATNGTLIGAIASAQPGDWIYLRAGTYVVPQIPLNLNSNLGVNLYCAPGVLLIRTNKFAALTMGVRVLNAGLGNSGPMIIPGEGSTVVFDGACVAATNFGSSSYDAAYGWQDTMIKTNGRSGVLARNFGFEMYGPTNSTLIIVGGSTFYGFSDVLYFGQTNFSVTTYPVIRGGVIRSGWDALTVNSTNGAVHLKTIGVDSFCTNSSFSGNYSHGVTLVGCVWTDNGSSFGAGGGIMEDFGAYLVNSTNRLNGTLFYVTGTGQTNMQAVYSSNSVLSGSYSTWLTYSNAAATLVASHSGDGSGLTNLNASALTGWTTNVQQFFTNTTTGEWGYRDTNGIYFKSNFLTGQWLWVGATNIMGGVGAQTNFSLYGLTGNQTNSGTISASGLVATETTPQPIKILQHGAGFISNQASNRNTCLFVGSKDSSAASNVGMSFQEPVTFTNWSWHVWNLGGSGAGPLPGTNLFCTILTNSAAGWVDSGFSITATGSGTGSVTNFANTTGSLTINSGTMFCRSNSCTGGWGRTAIDESWTIDYY